MSDFNDEWSMEYQADSIRQTLFEEFDCSFRVFADLLSPEVYIEWLPGPKKEEVEAFIEKHYPLMGDDDATHGAKPPPPLFPDCPYVPAIYCLEPLGLADLTPAMLRFRLAMGDDPNQVDSYGILPLARAIQERNLEIIRILTAAGADWGRKSIGGTPIHLLRTARPELIEQLAKDEEEEIRKVIRCASMSQRKIAL